MRVRQRQVNETNSQKKWRAIGDAWTAELIDLVECRLKNNLMEVNMI